jgi:hypothetical protein
MTTYIITLRDGRELVYPLTEIAIRDGQLHIFRLGFPDAEIDLREVLSVNTR